MAACLTDEEVVGLVALWRDKPLAPGVAITPDTLPVKMREDRTVMPKRFVIGEKNPAQTVYRNVMGGADDDLHQALHLPTHAGLRSDKKDLAIVVVFFD